MGLKPLEFSECLLDSPYFRDSIHDHEKELDETNDAIKALIRECKNLIKALKDLTNAQTKFAGMLQNFRLRYIGEVDGDDDHEYEDSFPFFASIIEKIEEERDRMLNHANNQLIEPLDRFRREQIGRAKEEKKKFDRETDRICALLETHTKVNPKKKDIILQENDAMLEHELRNFREMALAYVSKLHEVNEKKKFEFVEIMLSFIYGQATFFHNGHDVFCDSRSYLTDLQLKLQRTRENFDITRAEAEELKTKTTRRFNNGELHKGGFSRQGYLFVHERRKSTFAQSWLKHYCSYTKENKILTMIPYAQTQGKLNANTDTLMVESCIRKANECSDRRFLFDITAQDRTITLQSLSEEDRKQWLEVMEGKEPLYMESSELALQNEGFTVISDIGLEFARKCMLGIEKRGLDDQGIYRVAGVSSKFTKLVQFGLDPKTLEKLDLESEDCGWEIKTITSAMKQYFRNLTVPLLTYKHHHDFLHAIRLDTHAKKISRLQELLRMLPEKHYIILKRLMYHLKLVAQHADKNLMQASNLGVVLGPTLMRPREETMAAIMNIKYQSVVIENVILEYDQLFLDSFDTPDVLPTVTSPTSTSAPNNIKGNKYRAPEPPGGRPSIPKAKFDSDQPNLFPSNSSLSSSASNGSISSGRGSSIEIKQTRPPPPGSPLPKPKHGKQLQFAEALSSITNPVTAADASDGVFSGNNGTQDDLIIRRSEAMSADGMNRRQSYQLSMDERIKSVDLTDQKPALPPPIKTKPSRKHPPIVPKRNEWTVKTLYNCIAENDAELSFEANEIITNVRISTEEGWWVGTLNGKTGLVPKNYCEKID